MEAFTLEKGDVRIYESYNLKKSMMAPTFSLMYSYCMDSAIGIRYSYMGAIMCELYLWPDIMCFSFERVDKIGRRRRFNGRIDSYEAESKRLQFVVDGDLDNFESEAATTALVTLLRYLKCENFEYKKHYESTIAAD